MRTKKIDVEPGEPVPACGAARRRFLGAGLALAAAPALGPARAADEPFAALYAAAKKEGVLALYGGGPASWYSDWMRAFWQRYPGIRVDFTGGDRQELVPRIDAQLQTGRLQCDLVVLPALAEFFRWNKAADLRALPEALFEHVAAPYRDPGGAYVGVSLYTLSYAFNPSVLQARAPERAIDFLAPAYRDKIISVYPQTNDATLFLYWTIVRKYGWNFMDDLMANRPAFVRDHLEVARAIDQGKAGATFDTITELSAVQPGFNRRAFVKISRVDELPYWPQTAATFRASPHPNAALLFLRWSLERAQQRAMNRKGVWTVRDDVDPPDGFQPLTSYPLAPDFAEFVADERQLADLRARFNGYVGDPGGAKGR